MKKLEAETNHALLGLALLGEVDHACGKNLLKAPQMLYSKASLMLLLELVHVSTTFELR